MTLPEDHEASDLARQLPRLASERTKVVWRMATVNILSAAALFLLSESVLAISMGVFSVALVAIGTLFEAFILYGGLGYLWNANKMAASQMGATSSKQYIFVSYCRDNAQEARRLNTDLENVGLRVWSDNRISGGQDWRLEIRKALADSFAVVACFSKEVESRDETGMYPELRDAIEVYRNLRPGSVFIIPVRFSTCVIPALAIDSTRMLSDLQYIDLFPAVQRAEGMRQLIESLGMARGCAL